VARFVGRRQQVIGRQLAVAGRSYGHEVLDDAAHRQSQLPHLSFRQNAPTTQALEDSTDALRYEAGAGKET